MSEEITTLELGNFSLMSFRMHPSVPLQLLEFFYRKTTPYMVGALLGRIESTHIDITNCYVIPFIQEDEDEEDEESSGKIELNIDRDYHRKMFELNQKIYPKETLVGWFSNLPEMNFDAAYLHQFFASKESYFVGKLHIFNSPLIVLVDPFAENSIFGLKAYINQPIYVCKDTFGVFQQVQLTFEFGGEAKNEVASLWIDKAGDKNDKANPFGLINLDSLEEQLKETLENIKKLEAYVKDVNSGKEKGDTEIGRAIKRILNLAPSMEQSDFKDLLDKYMQDILMVMYLSNLANSQVLISEKLTKIA